MKKGVLVWSAVAVLSVSMQSFAATGDCKKNGNTMIMQMVTKSAYGKEQISTVIMHVKGNDLRSESYTGMGKSKKLAGITIVKGDTYYILQPEQKVAMKMSLKSPMAQGQEPEPRETNWNKVTEQIKTGGLITKERGKETWNGQEYTVWRATEPKMKSYTDYYVEKSGMIKRFVTYDGKNKLLSDSWFEQNDTCVAMPAGIFDVPAGYKIQEMPDMSKMYQGMKGMQGVEEGDEE